MAGRKSVKRGGKKRSMRKRSMRKRSMQKSRKGLRKRSMRKRSGKKTYKRYIKKGGLRLRPERYELWKNSGDQPKLNVENDAEEDIVPPMSNEEMTNEEMITKLEIIKIATTPPPPPPTPTKNKNNKPTPTNPIFDEAKDFLNKFNVDEEGNVTAEVNDDDLEEIRDFIRLHLHNEKKKIIKTEKEKIKKKK